MIFIELIFSKVETFFCFYDILIIILIINAKKLKTIFSMQNYFPN